MPDEPRDPPNEDSVENSLLRELGFDEFTDSGGEKAVRMEGTAAQVFDIFVAGAKQGQQRSGARRAMSIIRASLPQDASASAKKITATGAEAARVLDQAILELQRDGSSLFSRRLPAYEWLWLLRRLPLRFMWTSPSSLDVRMYMLTLALSGNRRRGELPVNGVLRLTPRHGKSLAFVFGYVRVIASCIMAYRWIGKGGRVTFDFDALNVMAGGDEGLAEKLQEYDDRAVTEGRWGGLGIHIDQIANRTERQPRPETGQIALIVGLREPRWVGEKRHEMQLERYFEDFVDLGDALALIRAPESADPFHYPPELGPLTALLGGYTIMAQGDGFDPTRINVRRVGYGVYPGTLLDSGQTVFEHFLGEGLAWAREHLPAELLPASTDELWDNLLNLETGLSPKQPGPVLVPAGADGWAVDWHTASTRFLLSLRFPTVEGSAANTRAIAFEESVKKAINSTPGKPDSWLDGILGRHLRLDGHTFGEIDAGASIGGNVHLVVSCKSYPFTEEYERGDYNAVRNVGSKLTDAAVDVVTLVEALQDNRTGDNYSIPEGAVLVPVVVTPRILFTTDPRCDVEVIANGGPRLVSGFGELLDFLRRYEVRPD